MPIRGGTVPCPDLSAGGANFHGTHEFIPVFAMEKMVEMPRTPAAPKDGR